MLLSQMWKALQRSKARIPSGVVVLRLKLSHGFCSDDFAETWRVMIRCCYKLIVDRLSEILALSFVKIAILSKSLCSIKVKSRTTNKHYIYIFTCVLFLDKLRIK